MVVRVFETEAEVIHAAADLLAGAAAARSELVVGWPTGRTMVPFYAELARRHELGTIDLGRVQGFNLDEVVLSPNHPASFHAFMEQHAWGWIGLQRSRCDIPNAGAADLTLECRRYEAAIAAAGGLDLAILGVGADGHIAYNQPGAAERHTHVVELPAEVADTLAIPTADRPLRAITMGLGTLWKARRIVLLATTANKADAIKALVEGPEDFDWPVSMLREHPDFEALVTADVVAGLEHRLTEVGE
jgi:glucosamine-6-phosphate deaminase